MANHPGGPPGPAPSTPSAPRSGDPRANAPAVSPGRRPVVGPASAFRGQLSAREDVWIEGEVEGEIQAPAHQVTVSAGGRVRAEVKARTVVIEGELQGNVVAEQMVMVRAGGRMQGDIRAPRVGLEEGCQFQGNVDMDGSRALVPAAAGDSAAATGEPATVPAEPPTAAKEATPAMVGEGGG